MNMSEEIFKEIENIMMKQLRRLEELNEDTQIEPEELRENIKTMVAILRNTYLV